MIEDTDKKRQFNYIEIFEKINLHLNPLPSLLSVANDAVFQQGMLYLLCVAGAQKSNIIKHNTCIELWKCSNTMEVQYFPLSQVVSSAIYI